MSSPLDFEGLATYFGFAPPALLARSPGFRQGEALFAGGFAVAPTLVKVVNASRPRVAATSACRCANGGHLMS
jgi:hypothetical protein